MTRSIFQIWHKKQGVKTMANTHFHFTGGILPDMPESRSGERKNGEPWTMLKFRLNFPNGEQPTEIRISTFSATIIEKMRSFKPKIGDTFDIKGRVISKRGYGEYSDRVFTEFELEEIEKAIIDMPDNDLPEDQIPF
jgi:hypothetical protein